MGLIGLEQANNKETGLEAISSPVSGDLIGLKTEFELAQLQKEKQIEEVKNKLNDFASKLIYTQKFKESDFSIQESLTGNFDLKTILYEKVTSYIYNIFSINIFQEKLNELEKLSGKTDFTSGGDEDNYIIQLRIIFRIQIPGIIKNLTNIILSNLKKNKIDFNKVTKITIQQGLITIVIENGKEIRNYEIVSDDKKGFKLKDPQVVNSDQRQEEKEQREQDLKLRHIGFPTIGLTLLFAGEISAEYYKRNQLKEVEFLDEKGENHKIRLPNGLESQTEQELIKRIISQIKEQTGYELNIDKSGKSFFESPESQNIKVSEMIEMVEKTFNFEDFKKKLEAEKPGEKIDENELKKEFEKQKAENIAFLRGIELQEGPLVKPSRFVRKLLVQSPKLMNLQHWIMYPVFFKEMQKKPGNLDSYFKGAGEMATFNMGVEVLKGGLKWLGERESLQGAKKAVKKVVDRSLSFLPGIAGTVTKYLVSTGFSVLGGIIGTGSGKYLAGLMKMQQGFDEIFPESEDILHKTIKKTTGQEEAYLYLPNLNGELKKVELNNFLSSLFSLGNKEIADFFKLDLKVPIFGRIWQHNLDLNTDKQEYLSGSMFRNRKFYNEMVDKMGDSVVDELGKFIDKYNDPFSPGFGGKVKLTGMDREILLQKRKKVLLKKIEDLIYDGDKQTNKSLKDTVSSIILYHLDDVISGKTSILELKMLTQLELERFKINDDFIKETEKDLRVKKYMFEITFGLRKDPPDKNKDEEGLMNYMVADFNIISHNQKEGAKNDETDNVFKYLKSLTPDEQNFAKNYFYRTLNKEEVIQTEQKDKFSDSLDLNKVGYFDDIGFFSSIGQATKDAFKDNSKFVEGENSDEAIYERLIKNPLFHEYTLWVKEYKNNIDFIESMKKQ